MKKMTAEQEAAAMKVMTKEQLRMSDARYAMLPDQMFRSDMGE